MIEEIFTEVYIVVLLMEQDGKNIFDMTKS